LYRIIFSSDPVRKWKIDYCPICGMKTLMLVDLINLRGTNFCLLCSANNRNKGIADILKKVLVIKLLHKEINLNKLKELLTKINLDKFSLKSLLSLSKNEDLRIYEPSSIGAIFNVLENYPNFLYSEYFPKPELKGGQEYKGIRFEDLQALSFKHNYFDIIITQDILEHIKNYSLSFKEIYRVLKPFGIHIFTVPFDKNEKTLQYFDDEGNLLGEKIIYHKDPLRSEGSKVFTQFGYDLINIMREFHFSSFIIKPKVGNIDNIEVIISIKNPIF